MKNKIYLDYAAATPMGLEVVKAMAPYWTERFYNPSAIYLSGREMRCELEEYREKVAMLIGARPSEIVFTAGATEANNLAIQGIMRAYPEGELLISSLEHESIREPAGMFNCKEISAGAKGRVSTEKIKALVTDKTVLISVMLVNNELGTIQPVREVASIVDEIRKARQFQGNKMPIYLHADAAQAGNYHDLHISRLGVDLMSVNGGKIYGPKQSGVLFVKAGTILRPLIVGGGQEYGLRSGTENLAAIAGLAKALELAQGKRVEEARRVTELRMSFEEQLAKEIPQIIINGVANGRAPHLSNITFPGVDNERLMMELDEAGIQCAVGSACSASRDETSHVLRSIGLSDEMARSTLRFSFGRDTDINKISRTIHELKRLVLA